MPEVAAALRSRAERIVSRWAAAVEQHLPDADPLTTRQVRDSIPMVLEKIALALESGRPEQTQVLIEVGGAHGVTRFQQHYNIDEVVVEYRLLRRIVFDEVDEASGGKLSFREAMALDMGIDTALQRGVVEYVRYLTEQLRSVAASELKYLSFLSHDLRNNLNGVTLSLEWLSRRLGSMPEFAEDAKDLEALQQTVIETVEGMDRLLQAERLRKQVVALKIRPVDLHALAVDLLGQVERKALEKGLRLENGVPAGAAAHSDRELITLVLQNLLGNAVKFSSRGAVRLEARKGDTGWTVSVRDEGPGIAAERVGQLFEAFARGETHGQPGMGLGLTIAAQAARLLGSELKVESAVGKGSSFSFDLPEADAKSSRGTIES